jgi:hypothetical protein
MTRSTRFTVLLLLTLSIGLLLPGLFLPVLTIRGVLTREGIAHVAPTMLEQGLGDETIAALKSMMNPTILAFMQATGTDLKKAILNKLGPQVTASLSIVGSVRRLYQVGSPIPATLILLFSVIVPVTKAALVAWAAFLTDERLRRRILSFVLSIAKWSMADVFVVALFIAYLAAQASTAPVGANGAPPLLAFDARFGSGFYWFAAYCLFSLGTQQLTHRLAVAGSNTVAGRETVSP